MLITTKSILKNILRTQTRNISVMAWSSSGATNAELVENLWDNGLITKQWIKDAMLKVDRAQYCPPRIGGSAYSDSPQPIGHSATISAPHMHASALESLFPIAPSPSSPASRILDIGSGSGYLVHVMAELGGPNGRVVGVEHIRELADLGRDNMAKSVEGRKLLESGQVKFEVGDGRKGWVDQDEVEEGKAGEDLKWDKIHVGASAKVVHEELVDQLRRPGRMFIPVDDSVLGYGQHIWVVDKDAEGKVTKTKLYGVQYVPLVAPPK